MKEMHRRFTQLENKRLVVLDVNDSRIYGPFHDETDAWQYFLDEFDMDVSFDKGDFDFIELTYH